VESVRFGLTERFLLLMAWNRSPGYKPGCLKPLGQLSVTFPVCRECWANQRPFPVQLCGRLWIVRKKVLKPLEIPEKVDKQKFEQVLARLIRTPPIRSKELVGKSKKGSKK
jgi:hypothetical protein